MSVRRLELAERAERDIRGIPRDTRRTWGIEQRDRYRRQLTGAMDRLTQFPEKGPAADSVAPGLRGRRTGQRFTCYKVEAQKMSVVRVVHVRMDLAALFADER